MIRNPEPETQMLTIIAGGFTVGMLACAVVVLTGCAVVMVAKRRAK